MTWDPESLIALLLSISGVAVGFFAAGLAARQGRAARKAEAALIDSLHRRAPTDEPNETLKHEVAVLSADMVVHLANGERLVIQMKDGEEAVKRLMDGPIAIKRDTEPDGGEQDATAPVQQQRSRLGFSVITYLAPLALALGLGLILAAISADVAYLIFAAAAPALIIAERLTHKRLRRSEPPIR